MLALFALIIVGFAMGTLGVALLCLGEVPFVSGKRIPAGRARLIGLILVSFLPLALGVRQASNFLLGPEAVEGPVLIWALCGCCWFVVMVILYRVMVPKRARKASAAAAGLKNNPFGSAKAEEADANEEVLDEMEPWPAPEPAKKPVTKKSTPEAAKKPSKPADDDTSPFDFT